MSDLYHYDGAEVVILRVPVQANETKAREIGALLRAGISGAAIGRIRGMRPDTCDAYREESNGTSA